MTKKIRTISWHSLERRRQPPIAFQAFLFRLAKSIIGAGCLVALALGGGMLGYHALEGLPWLDAFLNSAMILGGMGPVNVLQTNAGKLFAGIYALFSGLVFLVVTGLIFAPLVHRLLHLFHFDSVGTDDKY
jgi:hypothetical protein